MIKFLKNVVFSLKRKMRIGFSVDFQFHKNKPFRVYFASHQKEKDRILYQVNLDGTEIKNSKTFDEKLFFASLVTFNPYYYTNKFIELYYEDFEKINFKNLKIGEKVPLVQVSGDVKTFAFEVTKRIGEILTHANTGRYNKKEFNFSNIPISAWNVYRVLKSDFKIVIDLKGKFCPLTMESRERKKHHKLTGRQVTIRVEKRIIGIKCFSSSCEKNSYFEFQYDNTEMEEGYINENNKFVKISQNLNFPHYVDLLIKKCCEKIK